jgi:hypothetical protein
MAGFLETETVGTAPNRIFVIEWDDVPYFGGELDDAVTFAVQLFEGSNDIVFLYQDVFTTVAPRGAGATIGLQSGAQDVALQYSCNQPAVDDATAVYFPHPAAPNADLGMTAVAALPLSSTLPSPTTAAKGPAADLLTEPEALSAWQARWAAEAPPRRAAATQLDLTGNGRNELLLLWHSDPAHPHLTQAAVLGREAATPGAAAEPLFFHSFSRRERPVPRVTLAETADLTGDGVLDAVLLDEANGRVAVLSNDGGAGLTLYETPGRCRGRLRVGDFNQDGRVEIGRDQCEGQNGRMMAAWTGREFNTLPR